MNCKKCGKQILEACEGLCHKCLGFVPLENGETDEGINKWINVKDKTPNSMNPNVIIFSPPVTCGVRKGMTTIIYVNNEPLLCLDSPFYYDKNDLIDKHDFHFLIDVIIKKNNYWHLNCLIHNDDIQEQHDISNYKSWKTTPGKINPIWFENDCVKQITFLIE